LLEETAKKWTLRSAIYESGQLVAVQRRDCTEATRRALRVSILALTWRLTRHHSAFPPFAGRAQVTERIFQEVRQLLEERKPLLKSPMIVDATLIAAPTSTTNATQSRDPEIKQVRKGEARRTFLATEEESVQ
jgi:hypothetical protein